MKNTGTSKIFLQETLYKNQNSQITHKFKKLLTLREIMFRNKYRISSI